MARGCTICASPNLEGINDAILAETPYRDIAARYGTSSSTVMRHKDRCIGSAVVTLRTSQVSEARGLSVLERITTLQDDTMKILTAAKKAGRLGTAVMAIVAARQNLELLAKLTGELNERPQVLVLSPDWLRLRDMLIQVLAPFPEALEAVAHALSEFSG
jgi:hypothetical protein